MKAWHYYALALKGQLYKLAEANTISKSTLASPNDPLATPGGHRKRAKRQLEPDQPHLETTMGGMLMETDLEGATRLCQSTKGLSPNLEREELEMEQKGETRGELVGELISV